MKKVIGYLIVGVVSFAGGAAAGWIARKKTAEVTFEEVTAEEQAAEIAKDMGVEIQRPIDIQEAIDRTFGVVKEKPQEVPEESKIIQLDTQKEQYFKQWKAEETAGKYDTRTKEEPKDVVLSEEEDLEEGLDPEFLNSIAADEYGRRKDGPDIEEGSMEDWDHWMGVPDGKYDPVEVWWFDEDNVLTDNEGDPLENPGKYMGFDVGQKFEEISEDTTGDPDIRVVYNHRYNTIYQIIRKHGSYGRKTAMEEYGDEDDEEDRSEWIRARHD